MTFLVKIIVGSLMLAAIVVSINSVIGYFISGEFATIINIRSIILFSIVFIISMLTTIAEGTKTH